jgi:hypothetical protein
MSSHIALSVSPLWQPSHSSKVAKSKGQAARSVPFRSTVGGSSCISSQQDFPFHARHRPTFKNPTPLQKNSPHPIHSFHTRRQPSPSFLPFPSASPPPPPLGCFLRSPGFKIPPLAPKRQTLAGHRAAPLRPAGLSGRRRTPPGARGRNMRDLEPWRPGPI